MKIKKEDLAVNGGTPAKTVPYGTGIRFGQEEESAALAAIRSQKLWYKQGGTRVKAVEDAICSRWGIQHAITVTSGTAAVHTALVMCGVEPGDEVIVNPVTDWGSVAGILALQAKPVFCDIEEATYSLDPAGVKKAITSKTRAIVLVHISGYPARVNEIIEIAKAHNVKVIEDCAQAALAALDGRPLGTLGDVGAFSTNDSKHISCGEGGFVITNDAQMAEVGLRFRDKGYAPNRARGSGDVAFLGFNFRLNELSAAVLDAQLKKLPSLLQKREVYAQKVMTALGDLDGYTFLRPLPGARCAYWFIQGHLDLKKFSVNRSKIVEALSAEGIPVWPALSPVRVLYESTALKEGMLYPFRRTGAADFLKNTASDKKDFPVAERIADAVMPLHCNEFYSDQDALETAAGVRKVLEYYHV
jgi:dTDP-4-amino-4,6-dideoxygalactose transaminase